MVEGRGVARRDRSAGRPAGRLRASLGVLLLSGLATACASLPLPGLGGDAAPAPSRGSGKLVRPDSGVEYDFLVGELAARDGEFEEARAAFGRAVEKDPSSAYLYYRLARLAAQADDMEAAILHAERGLELDPDDLDGRLFLGRLYRIRHDLPAVERVLRDEAGRPISPAAGMLLYQVYLERGRADEALALVEALLEEDEENLAARMALATIYERMQRFDDAERVLREALDYHPNRFVLYGRLARMRRAAGNREGEVEIYEEVLAQHPGHYGTLVSMGEAQIALNDTEGAITTYTKIAEIYPEDLQVVRRLASLEFAAGHYEESAARLREAMRRHPTHFEFAYSLGQVLRGLGKPEEALEVFSRIPKAQPLYIEARMQIASIYEEQGRLDEALAEAEAIRLLRPERGLDFHVASLRARSGAFEGGVALLEALLEENPDDDEVLYQIGVLYGLNQDSDTALEYMHRVLEHNPKSAHALNYIGYTWAERGENLDEAERLIRQAVSLKPKDGYIADSLAWVYYMKARPMIEEGRHGEGMALLEEARRHLDRAVELTGGDPVVSEHLGDVYLLMDERDRALEYYEEAVDSNPREDEQPELMDKLDRLRREVGAPKKETDEQ
jgi:tetratricopeptide (TPR) repeat protein